MLQSAVHAALINWGKPTEEDLEPLTQLLLVQNHLKTEQNTLPFALRHAVDQVMLTCLELLAEQDEISARVLQRRFVDDKITRQVAQEMYASPDQVNRWQRTAFHQLTQIVYQQERQCRAEVIQARESGLPPAPYDRFFGYSQACQALQERLAATAVPWIVVITGIGGIGKTSLADFVVREALPALAYEQLLWLRVDHQPLSGEPRPPEQAYEALLALLAAQVWPQKAAGESAADLENQLAKKLKAEPHLIIIDNLETTAHIDYFISRLAAFTEPSRFLLTSRARPSGETAVYIHSLQELAPADAAALLCHHAEMIGLAELAEADEGTIEAIYQVTGGNPLALKLVVSLTAVLPLPQILADLSANRSGPIEDLYRHIYWEAWRTLTPPAQQLLQAMPLVSATGALPEQMQVISGLDDDDFWTAVRELSTRSLLEVQGTIQERRYGIHRLTQTFLQTEIIHWPDI